MVNKGQRCGQQGSQPVDVTADAPMPDDAALDATVGDSQPGARSSLLWGSQPNLRWFLNFSEVYYLSIRDDLEDFNSKAHALKNLERHSLQFKNKLFENLRNSFIDPSVETPVSMFFDSLNFAIVRRNNIERTLKERDIWRSFFFCLLYTSDAADE